MKTKRPSRMNDVLIVYDDGDGDDDDDDVDVDHCRSRLHRFLVDHRHLPHRRNDFDEVAVEQALLVLLLLLLRVFLDRHAKHHLE